MFDMLATCWQSLQLPADLPAAFVLNSKVEGELSQWDHLYRRANRGRMRGAKGQNSSLEDDHETTFRSRADF